MHRWVCTGFLDDTRDRIERTINEKPLSLFFLQLWSKFLWVSLSIIDISGVTEIAVLEMLSRVFAKFANNQTDIGLLQGTTANAKEQYTVLISAVYIGFAVIITVILFLKRWKTDIPYVYRIAIDQLRHYRDY